VIKGRRSKKQGAQPVLEIYEEGRGPEGCRYGGDAIALILDARKAMTESVKPAYKNHRALQAQEKRRLTMPESGISDGAAFYEFALAATTTTNLTADNPRNRLKEVARIHGKWARSWRG